MDGFPMLPLEISRLIIVEAVLTRGIKRAARLRLISQQWDQEIVGAIIKSHLLDGLESLDRSPFWVEYLIAKIMRKGKLPLSRQLTIVCKVAERVLTFSGDGESQVVVGKEALRECISELLHISTKANCCPFSNTKLPDTPQEMVEIKDSDEDYLEALLGAAAGMNNIALISDLLPKIQGLPRLITQDGGVDADFHDPIIGWPADIAAYKGNLEALRMLLSALEGISLLDLARHQAAEYANLGSQRGTLELCLLTEKPYPSYYLALVEIVQQTTSIDIFERVLALCKGYSTEEIRLASHPYPAIYPAELVGQCFHNAASGGYPTLMRHLAHNYDIFSPDISAAWKGRNILEVVGRAAGGGYTDVVAYLLDKGEIATSQALDAASKHGSVDCVRLLLDSNSKGNLNIGNALLEAVRREHTAVIRLLMDFGGSTLDDGARKEALEIAEREGLESVADMLRDFNESLKM